MNITKTDSDIYFAEDIYNEYCIIQYKNIMLFIGDGGTRVEVNNKEPRISNLGNIIINKKEAQDVFNNPKDLRNLKRLLNKLKKEYQIDTKIIG